jgi:N-acetylglucosaminyldiphosphoundecaprenol N-acetyl-beta-D-mannosaminyltransferase
MPAPRSTIGAVPFDPVTHADALGAIGALVSSGRGGFVVTPNVDHIVLAHRDAELRDAYRRARLSLADGQPVTWMARWLGSPLPERVSGADLIGPLMHQAALRKWNVFLFGASERVSAEAERRLVARHPSLRIVGRDTSSWSPADAEPAGGVDVVRRIRASGAHLVVVALGCPKQELWMARHEHAIAPAVALGLGGSLDFVAGAVPRAPRWMCRVGLEWLYRLAQEPRRLAYRYLVRDPQVVPIFAADLVRHLAAQAHAPVTGGVARTSRELIAGKD